MRIFHWAVRHLLVWAAVWFQVDQAGAEIPLHGDSVVRFATVAEGQDALTKQDRFVKAMSRFDRQSRLQTDRDVTEAEYLKFVADEVIAWTDDEVEKLIEALHSISKRLEPYAVPLPKTILLVHTTGKEEGNAAYCRANAIVLPRRVLERPPGQVERLLIHELFHVVSSHNAELREKLYAIIGFKPCPEIELPDSLKHRKITNPDAPAIDCFIELTTPDKTLLAAPVLYASVDQYDADKGGSFFRYLQFRLLVVEKKKDRLLAVERDGKPVVLDPNKTESFAEQIGKNTNYIIHPDEILADNFMHLVVGTENLVTPRIIEEMSALLKK